MSESIDELDIKIRACRRCLNVLHHPIPGMWNGNKVLFIFQNPHTFRVGKIEDEEIARSKNLEEFRDAYYRTMRKSNLNKFLNLIPLSLADISITNIVKCQIPLDNQPTEECILNCKQYTIDQVKKLKPQTIIFVSNIASRHLHRDLKQVTTNIISVPHYSFLYRNEEKMNEALSMIRKAINNSNKLNLTSYIKGDAK